MQKRLHSSEESAKSDQLAGLTPPTTGNLVGFCCHDVSGFGKSNVALQKNEISQHDD
jgi:hypothetical protein